MILSYLDEHLDAIPMLARWHHDQWFHVTSHLTLEDRIAGFRARARRGSIPTAFVALIDGSVVGMACLLEHDIDSHRHLTPWLTTVLVGPEHRGKGIGTALIRRAVDGAAQLGFDRLYLFTYDKEQYYARLGWSVVDRCSTVACPVQ